MEYSCITNFYILYSHSDVFQWKTQDVWIYAWVSNLNNDCAVWEGRQAQKFILVLLLCYKSTGRATDFSMIHWCASPERYINKSKVEPYNVLCISYKKTFDVNIRIIIKSSLASTTGPCIVHRISRYKSNTNSCNPIRGFFF